MKKIIFAISIIALLALSGVFITSCKAETVMGTTTVAAEKEESAASGNLGTIAFMWGGFDAPFVAPHAKAFTETATAAGAKVVNFDPKWDPALQNTLINDAIAMKVDLLAVQPIDPKAIIPALKKASEAGIAVMIFNTRAEPEADQYIVGFSGVGSYEQGCLLYTSKCLKIYLKSKQY